MLKDEWVRMGVVIAMRRKGKEILPPDYYKNLLDDLKDTDFAFALIDDEWYSQLCTIFISGILEKEIIKILKVAHLAGYEINED